MEGLTLTDLIWEHSKFVLTLPECNDAIPFDNDSDEFCSKMPRPSKALVDIKKYKRLVELKEKIPKCAHWEKWSKLVNPYDKVCTIAKSKNSKDYYKYFELFKYIGLNEDLNKEKRYSHSCAYVSLGLTALDSLKAARYFVPNLYWHVEGTYTKTDECPERQAYYKEVKEESDKCGHSPLVLFATEAEDDNLWGRITDIQKEVQSRPDLIVCDSYVNADHDPINQEPLGFELLLIQVTASMIMQSEGGTLVLRLFDTFTRPTCQLIYYLTSHYSKVSIVKPRTSNYTDSEKFVICQDYKLEIEFRNEEKTLNNTICKLWSSNNYCRILGITIPEEIEEMFLNYNNCLIENQCNYIEKAIICNYNEDTIPDKQLEAFQNKNALIFCSNFGISTDLSVSELINCRHSKKKKIVVDSILKNVSVCEKCFSLVSS